MSQILFQGNNLLVEGRIGSEYFCKPESNEPKDKRKHMYLRFIVQINGQMKVFEQMFTLTGDTENSPSAYGSEWALEDWDVWYTLKNVFSGLGYKFSDEKLNEYRGDNHIITTWILELLKTVESN